MAWSQLPWEVRAPDHREEPASLAHLSVEKSNCYRKISLYPCISDGTLGIMARLRAAGSLVTSVFVLLQLRKCLILKSLLWQAVPGLDLDALSLTVLLPMLLLFNTSVLAWARNLSCGVGFCSSLH